MRWSNSSRAGKSATPSPAFFRRFITPDPILPEGKSTLQTHQTTAEDELLSITNDIFPPAPNPEIDSHQITAWNIHAKHGPFRMRSPMKQTAEAVTLAPKQSLPSQLEGRSEMREELKAKLRQYKVIRSASFTMESPQQSGGKGCDDYWNEVEVLDLDKMTINAVSRQQRGAKKTMLLQPFFTLAIKRNILSQKRTKTTSSRQSSRGSTTHRNLSSPKGTIAHITELRFPLISEETKMQARLSLYHRQTHVSK